MTDSQSDRYGRTRMSRRAQRGIGLGLGALVVAVGVLIAVVGYQRLGGSEVEGTLAAYQLLDDETVSVTITVRRSDPSQRAVCIVRARSLDGNETGRREVLVAPSDQASVQVTTTVKTSRPPVMGDVYGCGLDVPAYLKPS